MAVFMVPGYSGGLSAPLISFVRDTFCQLPGIDVYGFDFSYDSTEEGRGYEEKIADIQEQITAYRARHPFSRIGIVGKSLGGALAMATAAREPGLVDGIAVLGWPVRLGWPARVSLLGNEELPEPPYKQEWGLVLAELALPLMFINGDEDSLMDFEYLEQCSAQYSTIAAHTVPHGDHGLLINKGTDGYAQVGALLTRFVTDLAARQDG